MDKNGLFSIDFFRRGRGEGELERKKKRKARARLNSHQSHPTESETLRLCKPQRMMLPQEKKEKDQERNGKQAQIVEKNAQEQIGDELEKKRKKEIGEEGGEIGWKMGVAGKDRLIRRAVKERGKSPKKKGNRISD